MEVLEKNFVSSQLKRMLDAREEGVSEFAKLIGVPYQTVLNYSNGSRQPGWEFLRSLHRFGINLDWFMDGAGEMYRANRPDQMTYQLCEVTKMVSGVAEIAGDTGGTSQRICAWAKQYSATHSSEDVGHLEERMRRAFPEFERFKG